MLIRKYYDADMIDSGGSTKPFVSGSLPPVEAIAFAKWLKHLDNGDVHYNPLTKAESPSIGFSPFDCFVDDVYTVEELYKRWKELGGNDR